MNPLYLLLLPGIPLLLILAGIAICSHLDKGSASPSDWDVDL